MDAAREIASVGPSPRYAFGSFTLDHADHMLSRNGKPVPLPPKAFDVLLVLVSRAGRLVKKEDLLKEVWPDTFVEEANLSYTVSLLRKALEASGEDAPAIETVPKLGYRFATPVKALPSVADPACVVGFPVPARETVPAPVETAPRRWWTGRVALVSTVVVLASLALIGVIARSGSATRTTREQARARFDIALPGHVDEGKPPTISPDGRSLVMRETHMGDFHLAVRTLDSPTLVPLAGSDGGWLPIWSPDSRSIVFLRGRTLTRAAVGSTASPIELSEVAPYSGGDWNADDVILLGASQTGGPISRVPASGGKLEPVTALDAARGETVHRWPTFLPDGRRFIFTVDGREKGLYVGTLDSRERKRIVSDGAGGQFIAPGHVLFTRGKTLMAQRFDPDALEVSGEAVALVAELGRGATLDSGFSASRSGAVLYREAQAEPTQLYWFDRDGGRRAAVGPAGSYWQVVLSPSGKQAAVSRRDPSTGNFDVYLLDLATGVLSRQTSHQAYESDPVWSPDERTLLFGSNRNSWFHPFRKNLVTGAEVPLLPTESRNYWADDWSRDGRVIVLRTGEYGKASSVFSLTAAGGSPPRQLMSTPAVTDQYHMSPAGDRIAYGSNESGTWEVYVASFPDFKWKRQVSVAGGVQPLWRRDGRELFYLTLEGVVMSVTIANGADAVPSAPQRLFDTESPPSYGFDQYAVTPDGQRFLFIQRKAQTITILQNWVGTDPTP